jgi:hypothetical protein
MSSFNLSHASTILLIVILVLCVLCLLKKSSFESFRGNSHTEQQCNKIKKKIGESGLTQEMCNKPSSDPMNPKGCREVWGELADGGLCKNLDDACKGCKEVPEQCYLKNSTCRSLCTSTCAASLQIKTQKCDKLKKRIERWGLTQEMCNRPTLTEGTWQDCGIKNVKGNNVCDELNNSCIKGEMENCELTINP